MRKDWIKIKNYYITHEISLEELAKKYKTSVGSVNKHCRVEKWVELKKAKSQEINNKVAEKITEKIVDRKVAANELHNELFEKGLKVAEMLLNMYMSELANPKIEKKKLANAYNLDFVMKAIANAQRGQRQALNIAKDVGDNIEPEVRVINGIDLRQI